MYKVILLVSIFALTACQTTPSRSVHTGVSDASTTTEDPQLKAERFFSEALVARSIVGFEELIQSFETMGLKKSGKVASVFVGGNCLDSKEGHDLCFQDYLVLTTYHDGPRARSIAAVVRSPNSKAAEFLRMVQLNQR